MVDTTLILAVAIPVGLLALVVIFFVYFKYCSRKGESMFGTVSSTYALAFNLRRLFRRINFLPCVMLPLAFHVVRILVSLRFLRAAAPPAMSAK